ncbi:MAG: 3-deoxy-D-manno-octulosonate 8-phosphate phosphatase [Marinilabiliales bacterium]|nr:MAG: 3-deoxy-D-manno-octulosonate 8-phosphate phosphatase [Marinilabiliales bacterium]
MEKEKLKHLNFKEILKGIEAFFFDIDGVLSSSRVMVMDNGELYRTTNVKDGYALKHALKQGIKIFIISGGLNTDIQKRFQNLGIENVTIACSDKLQEFNKIIKENKISPDKVLYMGDDIPDYPIMKKVGLPCCPADAASEIKEISLYISDKNGGDACVRDIVEQVLRARGSWMNKDSFTT